MKRVLGVLVMILLCSSCEQVDPPPSSSFSWLENFTMAKAEAKKAHRPILANFTGSDWCPWCKKLDQEIFSQKVFQDFAREHLVLFVADFPNHKPQAAKLVAQNEALLQTYQIEGFPTVLLLDSEGTMIAQTGYHPGGAEPFVAGLQDVLGNTGKHSLAAATNVSKRAAAPAVPH